MDKLDRNVCDILMFNWYYLNPTVKITDANMIEKANELHKKVNELCFIANSCNFKMGHRPNTITE